MGIQRENGYSATVEAYFCINEQRVRLARTNGCTFDFAQPQQLPPGTCGTLLVIVDGQEHAKTIQLPGGASNDETSVQYRVIAPF